MNPDALTGGFADAPVEAARAFRAALNALARPGRVEIVEAATPPAPLSIAAGTLLLTLADGTTPIHLAPSHDRASVRDWLLFHCGAPLVDPVDAMFAVGRWNELLPVSRFAVGTAEYPDRSVTLIVESELNGRPNARLSGPGIKGEVLTVLPEVAAFAANHRAYPLGFDTFLTDGCRILGLPRSTAVEAL
jgi:alpha-D-ribose 1-methylphosphonate 5-triphosphate synthase subunit PhnH